MSVVVAVATRTMPAEPWCKALDAACRAADLDATFIEWRGETLRARYAAVWLPPAELFRAEPGLRAVFNIGAGVDALIDSNVVPPQLPILRLVDAGMAVRMAEYVCFTIATITRGLHRFGPPRAAGDAPGRRDWNADRPRGAPPTVGVMGLGAIGLAIARAAAGFGYPVIGWSRTLRTEPGLRTFVGVDQLGNFLHASPIVVNVLPLTPDTRDLLNAERLAQLPQGAHLINIGRGGTIVDADLIAALDRGHVASATLDVFRIEPLPPDDPYWSHPKVTVTPHLSGPTPRRPAAEQIASMLKQLEAGVAPHTLPGFVDRTRGY